MKAVPSTARRTRPPKAVKNPYRGTHVPSERGGIVVPASVVDLDSYLAWLDSADYPEGAKTAWLNGIIWVETDMEELFGHNLVKGRFVNILTALCDETEAGYVCSDGMRFTNPAVGVCREPDAMFVSYSAVETGQVTLVPGKRRGIVEVQGTPDMVMEIVSESSVEKDLDTLRDLYWRAGVLEYWAIDAHADRTAFDILRRTPAGYRPARGRGGWRRSSVFGKSFRLTAEVDRLGNLKPVLAVR